MKFTNSLRLIIIALTISLFNFAGFSQSFEDLNEKADKEYAAKNYQKVIEYATAAITLKVNPRSYFVRADSRYSLKDYEAAQEDYTKALANYSPYYPTDKYKGRLHYWRGRCKQNLKNYSDAITDFNAALSHNFDDAGYIYWYRGTAYFNVNKFKESDEDYTRAIEKITDAKDLASLYKYRGDNKGKMADYVEADKLYTKAIEYNPNSYSAHWLRGYYRVKNSRIDEGLADYMKATSIIEASNEKDKNNDLAIIYRNIALMHYDANKNQESLTAINKSLDANPNYVSAYDTRAVINIKLKNYAKAKSDYSNAISLSTDDKITANLHFDRSFKLYWKILDYNAALDDLNKSIALDNSDGVKYWHRAITYGSKKNYQKGIADCNKAFELYGDNVKTDLYKLRASFKENTGDFKGALSDYRTVLKTDYTNASVYYELGRLFKIKMNNPELAETNFSKAIELSKSGRTAAFANVLKGDAGAGINLILEQVEKNKYNASEYRWQLYYAACVYSLSGNKTKALEYLDKSITEGFNDFDFMVNDRELAPLTQLPQYTALLAKHKIPKPVW